MLKRRRTGNGGERKNVSPIYSEERGVNDRRVNLEWIPWTIFMFEGQWSGSLRLIPTPTGSLDVETVQEVDQDYVRHILTVKVL